MAFARKYEYFEVRQMLKDAEGVASPVTGQGGHSRGLHAMSPGHLDKTAQLDRVTKRVGESNNQFKNRGGTGKTGAFKTLLQQGSAACEAMNSAAGQAALAVFDDVAHAGKRLRISIQVAGVKEAGFLPGTLAPHSTTVKKGDAAVYHTGDDRGNDDRRPRRERGHDADSNLLPIVGSDGDQVGRRRDAVEDPDRVRLRPRARRSWR